MLIYGAGGHAKVIISLLKDLGIEITAIFDDDPLKKSISNLNILGCYDRYIHQDQPIILAIGENLTRRRLAKMVGHPFANAFHNSCLIDSAVQFGLGNVVMHRAVIQVDSNIGNHCIINTGALIDHDCRIADFVHIGPGAVLCGNVMVGACTLIGAGSVVIPNVIIGKNCIIGAGSVVTKNIPDNTTVCGNPARIIKQTHYGKENLAVAAAYERDRNDLHPGSI